MKTQKIYLEITETYNYKLICGRENGNYTVKISKSFPNWYFAVCDLIDFYSNTEIDTICNTTEDNIILARNLYDGHKFDERKLRDYEPKVLVHSTIKEYSDLILSCGFVKCWNLLKQELINWEETPSIPIEKYMIWYSMPQIISIEELTTPKEFFEKSNKTFFHLYPQYA